MQEKQKKKKVEKAVGGCKQGKQSKAKVEKVIEDGADETWESLWKLINCIHSRAYNARKKVALLDGESQAKHFNIVVFYADMPWS